MENQIEHRFGESDWYNANDFVLGTRVEAKVVSFVGRNEYAPVEGEKRKAGFYNVDDRGMIKEYRLTMTNERILKNKFKMKGYQDLVGKTVIHEIKKYARGYGFVLVEVK